MRSLSPSRKNLFGALFLSSTLLLSFVFAPALHFLFSRWQEPEYSHGFFIPLLAFLISWNRVAERDLPLVPSFWSLPFLAISFFFLFIAHNAAFEVASAYGLVLGLVSLCLAFAGRKILFLCFPSFFYLFFAVPLPHAVQASLSGSLQLFSSTLGVYLLELFDIPVFQEGNLIDLGSFKLQVVEACSGLRYLFPLMSFGFLLSWLLEDRFWKRALVFFSSFPLAIGLNAFRIGATGVAVSIWGEAVAEGFLHLFEGWTVFIFCLGLIGLEVFLLLRFSRSGRFRWEDLSLPRHLPSCKRTGSLLPSFLLPFALLLLWVVSSFGGLSKAQIEVSPLQPLFNFPTQLDGWNGAPASLSGDEQKALGLSDYWLADYVQGHGGEAVNLYIAYYASQKTGASAHSPALCIPGGGWQILQRETRTLNLKGEKPFDVSLLLIGKGEKRQLVTFWFEERGHRFINSFASKISLFFDALQSGRSDGALIRLMTPLAPNEPESEAIARSDLFLSKAMPFLELYIPGTVLPSSSHDFGSP